MQGVISKNPDDMHPGKPHIFDFKIQENTLFLTEIASEDGPHPNPITYKLVRLE